MSSLWVFGYGSLVWNPGFHFNDSKIGSISGFKRRFWQGNDVHRGTPDKPGRVVTLIEEQKAITWGKAYEMIDEEASRAYLDHRESSLGGYSTVITEFKPRDPKEKPFPVLVYVALASNPLFFGPAPMLSIASQVAQCQGSSGFNVEYLAKLAAFMRFNVPDVWDEHLFTLEYLVRTHLEKSNPSLLHFFEDAVCDDMMSSMQSLSLCNSSHSSNSSNNSKVNANGNHHHHHHHRLDESSDSDSQLASSIVDLDFIKFGLDFGKISSNSNGKAIDLSSSSSLSSSLGSSPGALSSSSSGPGGDSNSNGGGSNSSSSSNGTTTARPSFTDHVPTRSLRCVKI